MLLAFKDSLQVVQKDGFRSGESALTTHEPYPVGHLSLGLRHETAAARKTCGRRVGAEGGQAHLEVAGQHLVDLGWGQVPPGGGARHYVGGGGEGLQRGAGAVDGGAQRVAAAETLGFLRCSKISIFRAF